MNDKTNPFYLKLNNNHIKAISTLTKHANQKLAQKMQIQITPIPMKSKKTNITKSLQVNEPTAIYGEQSIVFFKSFEEEEIHVAKARAALTYEQRMTQIEVLRKQVFNDFLLPNNTWPTIAPIFKIMPPYTSETR